MLITHKHCLSIHIRRMLLPLVYYLLAFFTYVVLYAYHRNRARKFIATLDLLQNLESIVYNPIAISNKRPFDQIKKQISSNTYFDRIRITFGIDLSASNEWHGRKTFQGQSLHKTQSNKIFNPYQKAISQLGMTFEEIFGSKLGYSCFTFGDETTKDYTYYPLNTSGEDLNTNQHVLDAYLQKIKDAALSGPTSFIPIIRQLLVYGIHCRKDFSMLIILTDELKISHKDPSLVQLIRLIANLPNVCLIILGVGDGPWQRMSYEERRLRELLFKKIKNKKTKKSEMKIADAKIYYDNFHFVDSNSLPAKSDKNDNERYLARAVLTKLPIQLKQAFRQDQNTAHF